MAVDTTIATAAEACILGIMNGHAFLSEAQRATLLEGKVGYREGLTHRAISESGGGQARAHLPATLGGVPTAVSGP